MALFGLTEIINGVATTQHVGEVSPLALIACTSGFLSAFLKENE